MIFLAKRLGKKLTVTVLTSNPLNDLDLVFYDFLKSPTFKLKTK